MNRPPRAVTLNGGRPTTDHDHIGLCRGTTSQREAGLFFLDAERLVLMRPVDHTTFDEPALARAAGAVLAAVRQADALANRGNQNRLVAIDAEGAAAGQHGHSEGHERVS